MSYLISGIIDNIKNGSFTNDDINNIKKASSEDLIYIGNVENNKIRNILFKTYFIVFNQKTYDEAVIEDPTLSIKISKSWVDSAISNKPKEIIDSYLGVKLITTDLIKIIKSNVSDNDVLYNIENQMFNIFNYLLDKRKDNSLLCSLLNSDFSSDDELLIHFSEDEKNKYKEKIIEPFDKLSNVYSYIKLWSKNLENTEEAKEIADNINIESLDISEKFVSKTILNDLKDLFNEKDDVFNFEKMLNISDNSSVQIEISDSEIKKETKIESFKTSLLSAKKKVNAKKANTKKRKIKSKDNGSLKFLLTVITILSLISFIVVLFITSAEEASKTLEKEQEIVLPNEIPADVSYNFKEDKDK